MCDTLVAHVATHMCDTPVAHVAGVVLLLHTCVCILKSTRVYMRTQYSHTQIFETLYTYRYLATLVT